MSHRDGTYSLVCGGVKCGQGFIASDIRITCATFCSA